MSPPISLSPAELPEVIAERYRVIDEIGRGGMGRVLRVVHEHTGEHLALKLMLSFARGGQAVERFKREARAFALIKSENVVRVIDAGVAPELDGAPFLVMELLEGLDLETLLGQRGMLLPHEVTALLGQAARALDKAHGLGIVHRDLKPANLFAHDDQGRPVLKLLDFGISKFSADDGGKLTTNGALLGTPFFMAPEQIDAEGSAVGPAADIWAMGMVAFRLLTGRVYWGVDGMRVLTAILHGEMPRPSARASQLGNGFDAWFARSCARPPGERFASVGEQIAELSRVLAVDGKARDLVTLATLRCVEDVPVARPRGDALQQPQPQPQPIGPKPVLRAPAPDAAEPADSRAPTVGTGSVAIPPRADTTPGPERRQVTIVFAKVSVTALPGAELDPEDRADAQKKALAACTETVVRAGSTLSMERGDGVLACFGFPIAYGDDAARAALAAMDLVQAASRVAPTGVRVGVRVGVDTGTVIASLSSPGAAADLRGLAGLVMERAPTIAAAARSGEVWVSPTTFRLLRGRMEGEALPPRELDGEEGVELVHITGEAPAVSARSTQSGERRALIGRDAERALVASRWEAAESGTELVLVTGEPGVGKSRLLASLADVVAEDGGRWLACRCSPLLTGTPLHPFVDGLERLAQIGRDDDGGTRRTKVERALSRLSLTSDAKTLLGALVGLKAKSPLNLSPVLLRQRTLEALTALLAALAAGQRTCLAVEDAHWADASSLELLGSLAEHGEVAGLLVIVTARPELPPMWKHGALTQIALGKLPRARVEALVREVAGRELPSAVVDEIAQRSDGVPLYVEELTLAVVESLDDDRPPTSGRRSSPPIPTTLRESLTARFDRAGDAKTTAQLASVLGRSFPDSLLARVSPLDAVTREAHLDTLVGLGLLRRSGSGASRTYAFKHALVQEAAYESLLKGTRRETHVRVARALEAEAGGTSDRLVAELAYHYESAGDAAAAVRCFVRAGRDAMARSAVVEASRHFEHALARVGDLPEADRARIELGIRTSMGTPLMILHGYGAPEVEASYARAVELAEGIAGGPEVAQALWGLWIFHQVRGRYRRARSLAEQLLALAGDAGPAGAVSAHLAAGTTACNDGHVEEATAHLETVVSLCEGDQHRDLAALLGQDPAVMAGGLLAWAAWLSGHPGWAALAIEKALERARSALHPNTLGFALYTSASLHQFRGQVAEARRDADELFALATEQKLTHWLGLARVVRGWAMAMAGDDAGIAEMLQGHTAWHATGARASSAHWESAMAEVLTRAGRLDEARTWVDHARAYAVEAGENAFVPEVDLADAELCLARGDEAAAEPLLLRAMQSADRHRLRSKALHAATRLARLYERTGRKDEARRLLEPRITAFPERDAGGTLELARQALEQLPR